MRFIFIANKISNVRAVIEMPLICDVEYSSSGTFEEHGDHGANGAKHEHEKNLI